jgi:hypothetical protein
MERPSKPELTRRELLIVGATSIAATAVPLYNPPAMPTILDRSVAAAIQVPVLTGISRLK